MVPRVEVFEVVEAIRCTDAKCYRNLGSSIHYSNSKHEW